MPEMNIIFGWMAGMVGALWFRRLTERQIKGLRYYELFHIIKVNSGLRGAVCADYFIYLQDDILY